MGLKHQSKHRPHHRVKSSFSENEMKQISILFSKFVWLLFFLGIWISLVLFNLFFFSELQAENSSMAKHNFKCSNQFEFYWTLLCQRGHLIWNIIRIVIIYYLSLTMIGNWQFAVSKWIIIIYCLVGFLFWAFRCYRYVRFNEHVIQDARCVQVLLHRDTDAIIKRVTLHSRWVFVAIAMI